MNKNVIVFCATAFVCAQLSAQSVGLNQEKETQSDSLKVIGLDEVVVSDSRFALKRENSGKTVVTIGAAELERNQGRSVAEIINSKSGLEISGSRSVQGSVLGVFARGGRGRQVLVIIDGVRVSDPSSFSAEYDLRLLAPDAIESIEIIKGAASTLYGPNAATAVINITTKKASIKKITGQITSSVGTNQTVDDQNFNISNFANSARISGTLGKVNYTTSISQQYADGISAITTPENEEDTFSNVSIDARVGYQVRKNLDISIYGNQTKILTDFDESFGLIDAPYEFLSKQERVGASVNFEYNSNGSLHFNGAYTAYDSESKSAFPNKFSGENRVMDIYNKYQFNTKLYTIVGLNYIQDKTDFATVEDFTITDPYLNLVYISDFGLNLNTGARLNNHSSYGSNFVFNVNPSFRLKMNDGYLKFMATYATSYITPSLTQLFGNFGPNPDLEPEDNRTIEGGMEYMPSDKFRIGILYFNRKEENFVFFDNASSTYQNAENTIDAAGIEAELNWSPSKTVQINANYTFTERKGDNAIRIPKNKFNAQLRYAFTERFNATLNYAFTDERPDTDFSVFPFVDIPLESFSLIDIYSSYDLMPGKLKVFVNVSNLLNEEYIEILGFSTRGRNARIGFRLNL